MWISLIFIKINILLVAAKLATIQNKDDDSWILDASWAKFNEIYAVTVNEEYLNKYGRSDGNCNLLDDSQRLLEDNSTTQNNICLGKVEYCWFEKETEARKKALKSIGDLQYLLILFDKKTLEAIVKLNKLNLDHTGNTCGCLCHRQPDPFGLYGNYTHGRDKEVLDSFCYDSITVAATHVVTGVKFSRRKNIIYLDVQYAMFLNGRILENTVHWLARKSCTDARKVIFNFNRIEKSYEGMKVVLEDMILPKDAVVTGIKFNELLSGKYYSENRNFITSKEVNLVSQCLERTTSLTNQTLNLHPPSGSVGTNTQLSESCKNDIVFTGTARYPDFTQDVVPYVDLREVVTKPPQPIRGVGWYHRRPNGDNLKYGGVFALRIFTETF